MSTLKPTRIGLIGLSASNTGAWAAIAHLPYLQSAHGRQHFPIVALCNSSVSAASAAIKKYSLDPNTKAYDNPTALAADPDVDMVVVSVRTDKHRELVRPALEAGKDAFVEWPLARNLPEAQDLVALAKQKGVRTIVGLEERFEPVMNTVRSLLDQGKIGKIVASGVDILGFPLGDRATASHTLSAIESVLGPMSLDTLSSALTTHTEKVMLVSNDGKEELGETDKDTFDNLAFHAKLVQHDAVISIRQRARQAVEGEGGVQWRIEGTTGEVLIAAPVGFGFESPLATIRLHMYETGKWEDVEWSGADIESELAEPVRNMARLYRALTLGGNIINEKRIGWEDACQMHALIDRIYEANVLER